MVFKIIANNIEKKILKYFTLYYRMSEKILFGNNVGYKITNYVIKKQIIDYLLNNVDQFKLISNNITEENKMLDIKNND